MKYFVQEFSDKERSERNFCLYCGICTDIEDIDILQELHFVLEMVQTEGNTI
jgi:hypothetical protein